MHNINISTALQKCKTGFQVSVHATGIGQVSVEREAYTVVLFTILEYHLFPKRESREFFNFIQVYNMIFVNLSPVD